jgi:AraC-like DNA-binding protein
MIADHAIAPLENETMLARMFSVLAGSLSRVPPAHAVLIRAVSAWLGESLSPRVEDLQAHVLYSPRQLQRLVDHYFGLPPKQLARKYRALRAMALLADPGIDEQAVDSIVSLFHDVAHLRRELQLFVGRTPPYIGSNDLPLNAAQLDLHNFREIGHPVARIPKSHAR